MDKVCIIHGRYWSETCPVCAENARLSESPPTPCSIPDGACCAICEHWDGYSTSEYGVCLITSKRVARLHVCHQWQLLDDLESNAHPHGTAAPAGTVQGDVGFRKED